MSDETGRANDADEVVTPGGPRPSGQVHAVGAGEAVYGRGGDAAEAADAQVKVLTPGGFRARSLVHRVDEGQTLVADDGRRMLMLDRSGNAMAAVEAPAVDPLEVPALGSGWIAYTYWNNGTGQPLTSFRTTWEVPPAPSVASGQTIFLFNGIQNYGANYGILQPVLQWGPSGAGGGPYWSVASWYVTSGGQAFHTNLVRVNPGDTLVGVMTLTAQQGRAFSYVSLFEGIAGTTLPVANIAELLWCNETLEAYSISNCANYPNTASTALRRIELRTSGGTPPLLWTPVNAVTDCGQHAVVVSNSPSGGEVDLFYR
ncbi:MAG TPA: hypothetical protein VF092_30510 [Longimicrobium sp.]